MKKRKPVVTETPLELAEALGLDPSDALEWEIRHDVTRRIMDVVRKHPVTVTRLAKESGTSRARITKILKGESIGISLDVLFRVLGAVGQKVTLSYKKAA